MDKNIWLGGRKLDEMVVIIFPDLQSSIVALFSHVKVLNLLFDKVVTMATNACLLNSINRHLERQFFSDVRKIC